MVKKKEVFDEEVFVEETETSEEEDYSAVDDDAMTAEEEGFIRGYNEADNVKVDRKAEAEEEELE